MPYLQLDVNGHYPVEVKQRLAGKLSATYADMMSVDTRRISIAAGAAALAVPRTNAVTGIVASDLSAPSR